MAIALVLWGAWTWRIAQERKRIKGLAVIVPSVTGAESPWFVEFEASDTVRLNRLESLVSAVKRVKDHAYQPDLAGTDYEHYLDEDARAWFAKSQAAQSWSFDGAINLIGICEYELLGVRRLSDRLARIEIMPNAYPYGGLASLRVLVEAFGHRVTRAQD